NFLVRIPGIREMTDDASFRHQLTQQLQSLTGRYRAEYGNASRVATGPVETGDEAGCDGVAVGHEHYRDGLGCRLDHLRCGLATCSSDHRDLTAHQISRHRRQATIVTLRPTIFDANVLAIHEPGSCKALAERV